MPEIVAQVSINADIDEKQKVANKMADKPVIEAEAYGTLFFIRCDGPDSESQVVAKFSNKMKCSNMTRCKDGVYRAA